MFSNAVSAFDLAGLQDRIILNLALLAAAREFQPMAPHLLHLLPLVGRLLRPQHVRRRRGGEFPQVSGEPRERGKGATGGEEGQKVGEEAPK